VKDKAREGLLKEFDERIYGEPRLLTLGMATFKAVEDYKKAYDEAILVNSIPVGLGNHYQNLVTMMRRSLPSTDWIPPVLAWYRKFKTADLLNFLQKLDNKFSADWILQLTPTQRIQNMNDVLKKIGEAVAPVEVLAAGGIFDYNKAALLGIIEGSRNFQRPKASCLIFQGERCTLRALA